jgi:branched-chain amino acid transport system permease protein
MNQILANAVISASAYLLVGLGFSLIYRTARFFHFAHGVVITAGAYAAFALKGLAGFPLGVSILAAVATSALLGGAMELGVYRPLRGREASPESLLLASLGLSVAIQALIILLFGAEARTLRAGELPNALSVAGARVTVPQAVTVLAGVICYAAMHFLLHQTKIGKGIRAVADDSNLAKICGVKTDQIKLLVFIVGSSLAGLAGVLLAIDTDVVPAMGLGALLMAMVAVIVGGVDCVSGILPGAILVALVQHLSAWWISSKWRDAIVFVVLILFLVWRPQGFLGSPLRKLAR